MDAPDDANDLRGYHFKQLLRTPAVLLSIVVLAMVVGVVCAALAAPAVGTAGMIGVVLVALVVLLAIADRRAASAFFDTYARQRGMRLSGRGPLPAATPLLRKGDDRYAERSLSGPLADDVQGTLALYTYEDETTDADGGRQTNYYRYTLGLAEVPECAAHVPELFCQRKFGLRALEGLEDAFRRSKERVELESAALDERYEIFAGPEQDQVWLRRLFSPTFVVWLGEEAPEKFAFELVGGTLCCYVKGHKESAEELDTIREASAAVARRLREESEETGAASSTPASP